MTASTLALSPPALDRHRPARTRSTRLVSSRRPQPSYCAIARRLLVRPSFAKTSARAHRPHRLRRARASRATAAPPRRGPPFTARAPPAGTSCPGASRRLAKASLPRPTAGSYRAPPRPVHASPTAPRPSRRGSGDVCPRSRLLLHRRRLLVTASRLRRVASVSTRTQPRTYRAAATMFRRS